MVLCTTLGIEKRNVGSNTGKVTEREGQSMETRRGFEREDRRVYKLESAQATSSLSQFESMVKQPQGQSKVPTMHHGQLIAEHVARIQPSHGSSGDGMTSSPAKLSLDREA